MQRYAATLRSGRSQLTLRSLRCPDRRCKLLRGAQPSIQRQRNAQDEVEQHDPNSEPVSPLQQYTQAFLQAGMKAPDTVRRVSEYVKDEPEQDSESLYMHERLVAIEHPAYPAPVRVAISGNSGIGKSTLFNATLGLTTLCPTVSDCYRSSIDAACLISTVE